MKKIFLLLLVFCACASKEEKPTPTPFPFTESQVEEWTTYEGNIILEDGSEGSVVLKLLQGEVGIDSYFQLEMGFAWNEFSWVRGKYTMLYGDNEDIIQLHSSIPVWSYYTENGKKQRKPERPVYRDFSLNFMSDRSQKLVLLDNDHDQVAEDARYTLYKRVHLFTAEGYITFEKTRTEFFEQNTGEAWNVAPLGVYVQAKKNYDSIAKENFEGIYMKALAYSVASDSSNKDNLVIKKILEVKRSPAFERYGLK